MNIIWVFFEYVLSICWVFLENRIKHNAQYDFDFTKPEETPEEAAIAKAKAEAEADDADSQHSGQAAQPEVKHAVPAPEVVGATTHEDEETCNIERIENLRLIIETQNTTNHINF